MPLNRFAEKLLEELAGRAVRNAGWAGLRGHERELSRIDQGILLAGRYQAQGLRRRRHNIWFSVIFALLALSSFALIQFVDPTHGYFHLLSWLCQVGILLTVTGLLILIFIDPLLTNLQGRLERSALYEKLQEPDELLQIHEYAVWPLSLLYLQAPSRDYTHLLKLLCCNLDWYLAPPRRFLRPSWLGDIGYVLAAGLAILLVDTGNVDPNMRDFLALTVLYQAILMGPRIFERERHSVFTSLLMLYFAERLYPPQEKEPIESSSRVLN